MQYMVVGGDGKDYGPVDDTTLRQWAAENRVTPTTQIRDVLSGQTMSASTLPGLFPQMAPQVPQPVPSTYSPPPGAYAPSGPPPPGTAWSQPPSAYPRAQVGTGMNANAGNGTFWRSIIYSVLGLVLFFGFQRIGIVISVFSVVYAIRSQMTGHRHGLIAIVVSVTALAAIGIGFLAMMR